MSDQLWVLEHADGCQHVVADDPTPFTNEEEGEVEVVDRYPEAVRRAVLPGPLDLAQERWDFDAAAIVPRWSPEEARDIQWGKAKAYRALRQTELLAVPGIVDGEIVVLDRDEDGQRWIDRYSSAAESAQRRGSDFIITFTDGANRPVTLDAGKILDLAEASLVQQAQCHAASQAVRALLDAAVASGATAAEILLIDITAGYPAP